MSVHSVAKATRDWRWRQENPLQPYALLMLSGMRHGCSSRLSLLIRFSALLVILLGAEVSFAGRASSPQRTPPSGIEGKVALARLVHMEMVIPIHHVYESKRSGLTLRIYNRSGRFVKSIQSEAGGTFKVNLSPGSYIISVETPPEWPGLNPVFVDVAPRKFTEIQMLDPVFTWWARRISGDGGGIITFPTIIIL